MLRISTLGTARHRPCENHQTYSEIGKEQNITSYQTTYPSSPGYVIEAKYTEVPQESLGARLKNWLSSTRSVPSPERAMQQMGVDRSHALLTASALRHTAYLSAMEQKAIDYAPQGAHRYTAIVDGYAEAAARMVRGWH